MNRRLLVVEPDAAGRAMLDRVLTAAGYTAEDFESARHARVLLDDGAFDLAVVDQLAGAGAPLEEVRLLRTRYPRLPLVVTGTMLSVAALLELLRLGVAEALPKPFTPGELRDAVSRALLRASPGHGESLDYAAAIRAAREGLASGDVGSAARALARAWGLNPLDADVLSLEALRAEFEGRDDDASRGYRAALALRHDEDADGPDPHEGLARLAAYGRARPVPALDARFGQAPLWIVADAPGELARPAPPGTEGPTIVVLALALTGASEVAMHLRENGARAFALCPTDLRPEHLGPLLARLGPGPLVAVNGAAVDLAGLDESRAAATGRRGP